VAGVDHEQSAQAVEVLLARAVPDVVAIALNDDRHTLAALHHGLAGEVHPEVVLGLLLKICFVEVGHAISLSVLF